MNLSGKCGSNLEAETHLCQRRCLVRFQGKNGLAGEIRTENYSELFR